MSKSITKPEVLNMLAVRINAGHEALLALSKKGLEQAMNVGDMLIEAKGLLSHGQWLPWLEKNCPKAARSAQRYMQLAQGRAVIEAKCATVADLTLNQAVGLLAPPEAEPEPEPEPEDEIIIHSIPGFSGPPPGPPPPVLSREEAANELNRFEKDFDHIAQAIARHAEYMGIPEAELAKFILALGWGAFGKKFQHGLSGTIKWWLVNMHSKYPDTFKAGSWEGSCGALSIDKLYASCGIPMPLNKK